MNKITPMTLAAARLRNPLAFDAAIERAVDQAVKDVGAIEIARSLAPRVDEFSPAQQAA